METQHMDTRLYSGDFLICVSTLWVNMSPRCRLTTLSFYLRYIYFLKRRLLPVTTSGGNIHRAGWLRSKHLNRAAILSASHDIRWYHRFSSVHSLAKNGCIADKCSNTVVSVLLLYVCLQLYSGTWCRGKILPTGKNSPGEKFNTSCDEYIVENVDIQQTNTYFKHLKKLSVDIRRYTGIKANEYGKFQKKKSHLKTLSHVYVLFSTHCYCLLALFQCRYMAQTSEKHHLSILTHTNNRSGHNKQGKALVYYVLCFPVLPRSSFASACTCAELGNSSPMPFLAWFVNFYCLYRLVLTEYVSLMSVPCTGIEIRVYQVNKNNEFDHRSRQFIRWRRQRSLLVLADNMVSVTQLLGFFNPFFFFFILPEFLVWIHVSAVSCYYAGRPHHVQRKTQPRKRAARYLSSLFHPFLCPCLLPAGAVILRRRYPPSA